MATLNNEQIEAALDCLNLMSCHLKSLSSAILPTNALPTNDAGDTLVGSLTESVMGMTSGLIQISDSIRVLADVIEAKDLRG